MLIHFKFFSDFPPLTLGYIVTRRGYCGFVSILMLIWHVSRGRYLLQLKMIVCIASDILIIVTKQDNDS